MSENTVVSDRALGLTSSQARSRLAAFGPNELHESETSLWLEFLDKLWAPVPWMLEATILLELLLNKRFEAAIIAILLFFNAALSLVQERRASGALALLRRRLSVNARVLRMAPGGRYRLANSCQATSSICAWAIWSPPTSG